MLKATAWTQVRHQTMGALLAACTLLGIPQPVEAQQNQKAVLVIQVIRREAPAAEQTERIVRTTLAAGLGGRLDYYSEFFDAVRFGDPEYEGAFVEFLRRKYAHQHFDVVIASSNQMLTFAMQHRNELFPDVPIVFYASGDRAWPPLATGVVVPFDLTGGLESAIRLHPGLRQVFLVSGSSEFDRAYEESAREQFKVYGDRIGFTYWSGLPMPELLTRVAAVPVDAVIFYLMLSEDGNGTRLLPLDALDQVARVANRPIYAWNEAGLGHGVVGGKMLDLGIINRALADLALRILKGESPDSLPIRELDANVVAYDWRELERWGIDPARLPAGSDIRFRQPGVWDLYKSYIVGAAFVVALQSALIAALVVQRLRRRRSEQALRQSEQRFRAMAEQNHDLAGRLISAQEEERTRIARDLHDDVSQQLAGVGIILSGLKRKVGTPALESDLEQTVASLQERTSTIADAIRTLSHQLHPSVLQHVGLVQTLRRLGEETERHHDVTVTFSAVDGLESLGPDVTLCLFRVAQEALGNAVRHSRARTILLQLTATQEHIDLAIVDDGRGFMPSERKGSGLGLRSMDERVRLARGTIHVQSRPMQGTTVQVRLPVASVEIEREAVYQS